MDLVAVHYAMGVVKGAQDGTILGGSLRAPVSQRDEVAVRSLDSRVLLGGGEAPQVIAALSDRGPFRVLLEGVDVTEKGVKVPCQLVRFVPAIKGNKVPSSSLGAILLVIKGSGQELSSISGAGGHEEGQEAEQVAVRAAFDSEKRPEEVVTRPRRRSLLVVKCLVNVEGTPQKK